MCDPQKLKSTKSVPEPKMTTEEAEPSSSYGLVAFFKYHFYDNFVPIWKWTVPHTGKKQGVSYSQILKVCRWSQILVAFVAIFLTLTFAYSRQLVIDAAIRDGSVLLLMELFPFIVLGYCLGMKRLPANYIPLSIMKFFVVLEKQIKPQVKDFQVKVLGESRFKGRWSVLQYNPRPGVIPIETQVRNAGLLVLSLAVFWIFSKFADIDLTQYDRAALVVTTAGTATAALLLVSSFSFEAFPEFKEMHRWYCELWLVMGVTAYIFILLYLFQRLRKSVHGKLKPSRGMILIWESAIFTFALYIMVCYVPVIHKGVSAKSLLQGNKQIVGELVTPAPVFNFFKLLTAYLYGIGEAMAKINGGLMKST